MLFVSTIYAVTTYSGASVHSSVTFDLVLPDQALLTVTTDQDYDPAALVKYHNDGTIKFEFAINSRYQQEYTFDRLFQISNNSSKAICFTLATEGLEYIKLKPANNNGSIGTDLLSSEEGNDYYLPPSGTAAITVTIFIPAGSGDNKMNGVVRLKARPCD